MKQREPKSIAFFDPDRESRGKYMLVHREDTKLCPISVSICQQCRTSVQESDVIVIKTVGARDMTDRNGKEKRYSGNIYLHILTKCLKEYDQEFPFSMVTVPVHTQEKLPNATTKDLQKRDIHFE